MLVSIAALYLPEYLNLGLPIYEGWWALLPTGLLLLIWLIALSWMVRPAIWFAFNVKNGRQLFDCIVLWALTVIMAGYFIGAGMIPVLHKSLIDPKQEILLDNYHVKWVLECRVDYDDCNKVDKQYLYLDEAETQKLRINESTYEWLKDNYTSEKVTKNRMTKMVHTANPIKLIYKPNAKIVFDIKKTD